ncbi:MAG: cell envelope integrity protein CreD [Cyclobacteriaceae bacterium]
MKEEQSIPERINNWIKHSVTLKLISITILILLLLIPSSMIKSVISEREMLNHDATQEVSSKWANRQFINGPILSVPLIYEMENEGKKTDILKYLHVLPEVLDIKGVIDPERLKRGIYEVVVYKSNLKVNGSFVINPKIDQNNLKKIKWEDAFLTLEISDLRGIENDIILDWDKTKLKAEPGSRIGDFIQSGVTFNLPDLTGGLNKTIPFRFDLNLQGSQNMSFVPIGSTTTVSLNSPWTAPSFNGNFLPRNRDVSESGFSSGWKVLQLNRNFPQSWTGNRHGGSMDKSAFGVDLLLPLDDYQKSMRSAKYALMTIALTFLIFFLVEVLNGRKIHPFQYTLVGVALCLFYTLLISISEHSNFNLAYFISAVVTVLSISLYSLSVFKSKKLTSLLVATLSGIYGFLFVTLQLADYALLMGSIGLSIILGATMYFTRNINWYQLKTANN